MFIILVKLVSVQIINNSHHQYVMLVLVWVRRVKLRNKLGKWMLINIVTIVTTVTVIIVTVIIVTIVIMGKYKRKLWQLKKWIIIIK